MVDKFSDVIHVVIFVFDHHRSAAIPLNLYVEVPVILRHLANDIFIGMNCECLPHDDQDKHDDDNIFELSKRIVEPSDPIDIRTARHANSSDLLHSFPLISLLARRFH
jgi:hypothetical protein